MMTAWRMNEWEAIRFMFGRRFKTDIGAFLITMLATISLDLTQAILIGSFLAGGIFLNRIASLEVQINQVDPERLRQRGIQLAGTCPHVSVAFVTGPLFFAATGAFNEAFVGLKQTHALILSMRGVPLVDTAGIEAIRRLHERLHAQGGRLMFAGVHNNVRAMLERGGLLDELGEQSFFWSSDQAILAAEQEPCGFCQAGEPKPA
jgi:SulP family sulfate permease